MSLAEEEKGEILLLGGYGVLGKCLAKMLNETHPNLKLVIGGRNLEKATAFCNQLTNARPLLLDVNQAGEKIKFTPRAIVFCVTPPLDLCKEIIDKAIPAIEVSLPTPDAKKLKEYVNEKRQRFIREGKPESEVCGAAFVFASSFYGGLINWLGIDLIRKEFEKVNEYDAAFFIRADDVGGPDSLDVLPDYVEPFECKIGGALTTNYSFTKPRLTKFDCGEYLAYLFETPDTFLVPEFIPGGLTVTFRIAMDDPAVGYLNTLRKLGILRLLAKPWMGWFRKLILPPPGEGGKRADARIFISGVDKNGKDCEKTILLWDEKGNIHLTAIGMLKLIERLLGLDHLPPVAQGLVHCYHQIDFESTFDLLKRFGVQVKAL